MFGKVVTKEEGKYLTVLGDHQRLCIDGQDSAGAVTVIEQANPPGVGVPLHVHTREDEVWHVISGSVEFEVGGRKVVAGAGDTVFGPRGVPHSTLVVGNTPARVLLTIVPGGLEEMFDQLSELGNDGPPDLGRVAEICGRYGISFV